MTLPGPVGAAKQAWLGRPCRPPLPAAYLGTTDCHRQSHVCIFPHLRPPATPGKGRPQRRTPPTLINLPRYQPYARDYEAVNPAEALTSLLEQTGRSTAALGPLGFSAIGLDLKPDATAQDLVPDLSYMADFAQWNTLTTDEARDENQASRRPLRTGNLAPRCQVYLERKKELSNNNADAFRTVRRIAPPQRQTASSSGKRLRVLPLSRASHHLLGRSDPPA